MKINDGYYIDAFLDNPDSEETEHRIEEFKLCPFCFIRGDFAILQESNIKIESIVVQDEFGEFLNMDVEDFTKIKASGFNPHPDYDDDDEQQGPTDLRDDWPHAITVPGGARLPATNNLTWR